MKKNQVIIRTILWAGIVIAVNLVATKLFFRLDFTEDKRYTLSASTLSVIDQVDDVITVKAYFSEDLPPQLLNHKEDFKDLLVEYENRSNGNVVFEFINPNVSEEKEQEAQQKGIPPLNINVLENDKSEQMRAYMGAVIEYGESTEVIPLIDPQNRQGSKEFLLTKSIKKLTAKDKPRIGIVQGHGEPSLQGITQLNEQLSIMYEVETVVFTQESPIPSYIKTLIWIAPADTIPLDHLQQVDRFLASGGSLWVAYSPLKGDMSSGFLSSSDNGMAAWLSSKGVTIGSDFVVDASCGNITVQQQNGFFTMRSQIRFPYFPIVSQFSDHMITQGLEAIIFPFVSKIQVDADKYPQATALIYSSENSGLITPPQTVDIEKQWVESDFQSGAQPLAYAIDGFGNEKSKLVVVGSNSFIVNGDQQPQQLNEDNVNFATNSIDWLAGDTGLIALRTKGVTARPLAQVEDNLKNTLKYANVLAPILLIIGYGFWRRAQNAKKVQQWLKGNYA